MPLRTQIKSHLRYMENEAQLKRYILSVLELFER